METGKGFLTLCKPPPPSWLLLESLPTAMVPGPALCVILGVLGLRVAGDCRA